MPVSADVESGYGTPPAELIERVLEAGAVGINIEDTVHREGRMRSVQEHADYIGGLRQASDPPAWTSSSTPAPTRSSRRTSSPTRSPRRSAGSGRARRPVPAASIPWAPRTPATVQALLDALEGPVNVIANPLKGSAAG